MKYGRTLTATFAIAGLTFAQALASEAEKPATESEKPATETEKPATETEKPATETEKPATEGTPSSEATPSAPVEKFTIVLKHYFPPASTCPKLADLVKALAEKGATDPLGLFKHTVSQTMGGNAMQIAPADGGQSFAVSDKAAIIDMDATKYMVVMSPGVVIKALIDAVQSQTPPTITQMSASNTCQYKVNGQTMVYVGQVTVHQ
jgi:hypothetical protein